jgi:zinc and cadmium transporter
MLADVWVYTIGSVALVSIVSFIGIFSLALDLRTVKKILLYLVSFAAGAFFGDIFFHIFPEIAAEGFTVQLSLWVLAGIVFSFLVEKVIRWRHCHTPTTHDHPHPVAIMNLIGDAVHNFIDGLIIGASYLVNIPVGIATTMAVIFHEIPQEIGDFGVLLHGGFSRRRALFFNFLTAVTSVLGAAIALLLSSRVEQLTMIVLPFAAGNFLYIAGSDLIPELHDHVSVKSSTLQFLLFIFGIAVMATLLLLE